MSRQCPGRCGVRGDGRADGEAKRRKPRPHILNKPRLASEQMRDAGHVEPQPIDAVHLDQRRPAPGPAGKPLHQRRVAYRIGGDGDQPRIERPRVCQPCAGPRAALGGGLGHRMNDEAVRSFDREGNGSVRR